MTPAPRHESPYGIVAPRRPTTVSLLVVACCGLAPVPSWAHAFLDGALPRVGSESPTVPTQVVLHFTQGVEPAFSRMEVQDASGALVTAGAPYLALGDPTRLAVALKRLNAGVYTVTWQVTSVDTHKTQGKFHFTVAR